MFQEEVFKIQQDLEEVRDRLIDHINGIDPSVEDEDMNELLSSTLPSISDDIDPIITQLQDIKMQIEAITP